MSRLGCAEVLPHLESHHRGDASKELAVLLDDHLGRCPECRRRLAHLKQVSAMLAAWRPRNVPAELKIEVAEAVSESLGAEALRTFARGARPAKKRSKRSGLSPVQRAANALALAALVVLAGAIIYKVWTANVDGTSQPPAPHEVRFAVRLIRIGPAGETGADLTARQNRVAEAICAETKMSQEDAAALLKRLPATLCHRPTRIEAEAVARRLESVGARVEVLDTESQPDKSP